MFTVRRAIPSDAEGIARVHVDAWRVAYAHILPEDVLTGFTEGPNAERKRRIIEGGGRVFIAEEDGVVLGFAICGPNRQPEVACDGELQAIYVHPDSYRGGIGRGLLKASADQLLEDGFTSMAVFCFRDNHQAKAFYTKHGAIFNDSGEFEIAGVKYPDESYIWPSLPDLQQRLSLGQPQ